MITDDDTWIADLVPEYNKVYERHGHGAIYPLLFLRPADPDTALECTPDSIVNAEVIACFTGDYKYIVGDLARRFPFREASPEVAREFLMGTRRALSEGLNR